MNTLECCLLRGCRWKAGDDRGVILQKPREFLSRLLLLAILALYGSVVQAGLEQRPDNLTCVAPDRLVESDIVTYERTFPDLRFSDAIQLVPAPDKQSWLVVERAGNIVQFLNDQAVSTTSVFLDITDRVFLKSNGGVQSIAFHPNYPADGRVFVSYTGESGDTTRPTALRVSSFTSSDGGATLDPSSEQIILSDKVNSPIHGWGTVAFGLDGYLYVGMGANDPLDAQDTNNWHGTFVRIDIDSASPYAIPPDNPFVNGGGAPEIFAWGFRNPFRWSFDDNGNLWSGDVGGNDFEEINIVVKGGNYGWPNKEALNCRKEPCDGQGFIDPVSFYAHQVGSSSAVLGGMIYQGSMFPELQGKYIYSDIANGTTRAVTINPDGTYSTEVISTSTQGGIRSWAADESGEIYGVRSFLIERLVRPDTPSGIGSFPNLVSEIGCFLELDPSQPGSALIPYDINVPFWSDTAAKERWFVVPDNEFLHINNNGGVEFPIGSMLFKNFRLGDKLRETRLLVRHNDGGWGGYSYEWDDAETDGVLVSTHGKDKLIGDQLYSFPGRSQCFQCHTEIAGITLGPETAQLNRSIEYPSTGTSGNQLATYDHILLLDSPLPDIPDNLPAFPETTDTTVSIEERARAYLHSNCAQCHSPGGPGGGGLDFRFETLLGDVGIINTAPGSGDLGVLGAKLVLPGDPSRSVVPLRMRNLGEFRMPPLGSHVMDAYGVALIEHWIKSLDGSTPAPTVVLGKPIDDSSFAEGDAIPIVAAVAVSSGSITKVEFFANGIKLGEDTTSPYEFNWANVAPGEYVLTATAIDDNQVVGESERVSVLVKVGTANTAPGVSINIPASGSSFPTSDSISFSGTADDAEDGDLTGVLSWNSSLDGPIGSSGGFFTTLSAGTHMITASVIDSGGRQGTDTVTISVDEAGAAGSVSINDRAVYEGNSGTRTVNFTVKRSGGSGAFMIDYATGDGTAEAGSDYVAQSGTLSFGHSVNTQSIVITLNGDNTFEADETFFINLSGATNEATISDSQGLGTIINNDAPTVAGSVVIKDRTIIEGNSGTKAMKFTVRRSMGTLPFSVNFATVDGTAEAGSDYMAQSGTLSFGDGVVTQVIAVTINGDTMVETDETFFINLSGATDGATISDGQGLGTISNNDAPPIAGSVVIKDRTIIEGNSGTKAMKFTLRRSNGTLPFSVNYVTADGTAEAGSDYVAQSGTVSFGADINTQTIEVTLYGDTTVEADETLFVNLSGATNGATIDDGQGLGTISNNDTPPVAGSVSIVDRTITEGNSGTKSLKFTVRRSKGSLPFSVNYATADGTAEAGSDYVAQSGTLSFGDGVVTQVIAVTINGDTTVETDETFFINLSGATDGATISDGQGLGTISNNDAPPVAGFVVIKDRTITEGNSGAKAMKFTLRRSKGSLPFSVNYATADGTAEAGSDYVAQSGTVSFGADINTQTIAVTLYGDTTVEADETLFVNLSGATDGAAISDGQGLGTITNND